MADKYENASVLGELAMWDTMKKSAHVVGRQYRPDNRPTDGNITLAGICLPKTSHKFIPLRAASSWI